MNKRNNVVTFQGNPLVLLGPEITVGMAAPDFTVVKNDLAPATLADLKGQVTIISVVPSLDTGVCDVQTRRFNQEAGALGGKVRVVTVSMDLPFAQARWCGNAGVENVQTVSDYQTASFGQAYGVLIEGLRLLARAIFVVDSQGKVAYVQIVPEMTHEPDYAAALDAAKKLLA
ncbi:thiol peroxidase [Desulfomicrobium orale]|uniref:Thiol peroxidase n=1 Tax=Desulfomicrobium orale DSM 12838 TaxID=888061 RepID=A0A109WBX1_9BACT|nr:thiol peroxidase [Desulfomicrobium orale]AMD93693.1 redoxin [Desulfomicrobium orale DSM 12838]